MNPCSIIHNDPILKRKGRIRAHGHRNVPCVAASSSTRHLRACWHRCKMNQGYGSPSTAARQLATKGNRIGECMVHLACPVCQHWALPSCVLPCGHCLCTPCASSWLVRKQSCPVCRAPVDSLPVSCQALDNFLNDLLQPHTSSELITASPTRATAQQQQQQQHHQTGDWAVTSAACQPTALTSTAAAHHEQCGPLGAAGPSPQHAAHTPGPGRLANSPAPTQAAVTESSSSRRTGGMGLAETVSTQPPTQAVQDSSSSSTTGHAGSTPCSRGGGSSRRPWSYNGLPLQLNSRGLRLSDPGGQSAGAPVEPQQPQPASTQHVLRPPLAPTSGYHPAPSHAAGSGPSEAYPSHDIPTVCWPSMAVRVPTSAPHNGSSSSSSSSGIGVHAAADAVASTSGQTSVSGLSAGLSGGDVSHPGRRIRVGRVAAMRSLHDELLSAGVVRAQQGLQAAQVRNWCAAALGQGGAASPRSVMAAQGMGVSARVAPAPQSAELCS